MGLLDLLGRGDLRRALEAEAGGDYAEAARAYASAGRRYKVAEMHLLGAERAATQDDKLDMLRDAARWCDDEDDDARKVRRRVAASMLALARKRGIVTDADRTIVADAAGLFLSAGDAAGAGACHELLGANDAAAEAYQAAGEVDRLEQILESEVGKRRRAVAASDAIEEHRLRLRAGDPEGAITALDQALEAAEPRDRAGLEQLRMDVSSRRVDPNRLVLRRAGLKVIVAAAPVTIGRELGSTLPLRDPGVSRHHAELRADATGWSVVDLGSKNGSTLGGIPIAGRLSLPAQGELGIGDSCKLDLVVDGAQLRAEIVRGLDRGVVLHAASGTIEVGSLRIRFVEGRARVGADGLVRSGITSRNEIEPLVGDVLEAGGDRWEVAP